MLEGVEGSVDVVVVNMSQTARPDIVADLTRSWPFQDRTFDAVVSTWGLEHLKDPGLFFHEAYRLLSERGFLVVTVPFIHHKHGSSFDYWRFTDTALVHLATSAGFKHVQVRSVGGTPFLCVIALLWPFFRISILGSLLALVAAFVDYILLFITRMLKKSTGLFRSYPISYILYACKEQV